MNRILILLAMLVVGNRVSASAVYRHVSLNASFWDSRTESSPIGSLARLFLDALFK